MDNQYNKSKKYFDNGLELLQIKSYSQAEAAFRKANELTPNRMSVLLNLSTCLIEQDQWDEAFKFISLALELIPDDEDALLNLGIYQAHTSLTLEALASFDKVLSKNAKNEKALINKGNILQDIFQHHEALDCFNIALEINPTSVEALIGRGNVKNFFKLYDSAIRDFEAALNLDPENPKANTNKGMALIRLGDFKNGWKFYEHRWGIHDIKRYGWQANIPTWNGEYGGNKKTILVLSEQGFGDNIQLARYLPLLTEKYGFNVQFYSPKALCTLMQTLHPKIKVVSNLIGLRPNIEYQIPIMSLPYLFGTDLSNIPADTPYFFLPPDFSLKWRERISESANTKSWNPTLQIGICWRGSGKYAGQANSRRDLNSQSLELLVSKLKDQNVQLHSLQADLNLQDIQIVKDLGLYVHQNDLSDFLQTAYLINGLDIVISIDTAVGHLSGALNKLTFLLLPDPPDFMSLIDREDTPWYPSTLLIRQDKPGDWTSVITKLMQHLNRRKKTTA